jgi:hypothetical protein
MTRLSGWSARRTKCSRPADGRAARRSTARSSARAPSRPARSSTAPRSRWPSSVVSRGSPRCRTSLAARRILVDRQEEIQPHLERALQTALEEMRKQKEEGRRGAVPSGLTREEEGRLSEAKGEMAEDLQGLERQAQEAIRRLGQSAPDAARKLRGALGELQQSEASTRLQTAADYIRRGGAPYVANSEEGVARALRDFRDNVQEAEQIAQNGGGERGRGDQGGDQLAQALTRMEQLRRDLEKAAGLDDPSGRRGGQQPGQEQGQDGQQGRQQVKTARSRPTRSGPAAGPARSRASKVRANRVRASKDKAKGQSGPAGTRPAGTRPAGSRPGRAGRPGPARFPGSARRPTARSAAGAAGPRLTARPGQRPGRRQWASPAGAGRHDSRE